jgi:hypothetical protein
VAERYADGRVFLAGDAAHEMPPTGGFGMNTGVQDVHNLAWKLAAVVAGRAAPSLLETYHAERQPVGRAITEQSLANSVSMGRLGGVPAGSGFARPEYLNEQGMIFGAAYASAAVVPDGSAPPAVANPVTDYAPSARPGGRAPHAWLVRDGAPVSTIDLVRPGFVLFAGRGAEGWRAAARRAQAATGVSVDAVTIGPGGDHADPDGAWAAAYEVDDGAVLVRPDGHVAWRTGSAPPDPGAALEWALARVLGRAAAPSP